MQLYDVAGYHVRGMLKGLAAVGLEPEALLTEAGIDRVRVDDPEARFSEPQLLQLWLAAERRWQRPEPLSLVLGTSVPCGALELIDYLVAAAATVGEAITTLARHGELCASGFFYGIERDQGTQTVRVRLQHRLGLDLVPPGVVEYLWTLLITRLRAQTDARFRPRLCLRRPPGDAEQTYRKTLGEVTFLCEHDELHIPDAQWALDNPRRDPVLSQLLHQHARDVFARVPPSNDFQSCVRVAIADGLRLGDPSIEHTARRLALTARTLQRRLVGDGLEYRQLLGEVRFELAHTYLTRTQLSLTQISDLLGYAEQRAFQRAFRRWKGATPAAYRLAHREPVSEGRSS